MGLASLTPSNESAQDPEPVTPVRRGRPRKSELPPTPSNSALNTSQSDSVSRATNTPLTLANLNQWRKVELVEECRRRGLSYQGRKVEMRDRILHSISPEERPSVPIAADDSGARRSRSERLSTASAQISKGIAVQTSTQSGPSRTTRNFRRATTAGIGTSITVDGSNPFPPSPMPGSRSFSSRRLRSSSAVSHTERFIDDVSNNPDSTDDNMNTLRFASTDETITNERDSAHRDSNRSRGESVRSPPDAIMTDSNAPVERSDDLLVDKTLNRSLKESVAFAESGSSVAGGENVRVHTLSPKELVAFAESKLSAASDENARVHEADNIDLGKESIHESKSPPVTFAVASVLKGTEVVRAPSQNAEELLCSEPGNNHEGFPSVQEPCEKDLGSTEKENTPLLSESIVQEAPEGPTNNEQTDVCGSQPDHEVDDHMPPSGTMPVARVSSAKPDVQAALKIVGTEAVEDVGNGEAGIQSGNNAAETTFSGQVGRASVPERESDEVRNQERTDTSETPAPESIEIVEKNNGNSSTSKQVASDTIDNMEIVREDDVCIVNGRDVALDDNSKAPSSTLVVAAQLNDSPVRVLNVSGDGKVGVQVRFGNSVSGVADSNDVDLLGHVNSRGTSGSDSAETQGPGLLLTENVTVDAALDNAQVELKYTSGNLQALADTDRCVGIAVSSSGCDASKASAAACMVNDSGAAVLTVEAHAASKPSGEDIRNINESGANSPTQEDSNDIAMPTCPALDMPDVQPAVPNDIEMAEPEVSNTAEPAETKDSQDGEEVQQHGEKKKSPSRVTSYSLPGVDVNDKPNQAVIPNLGDPNDTRETAKQSEHDENEVARSDENSFQKIPGEDRSEHPLTLMGNEASRRDHKRSSSFASGHETFSRAVEGSEFAFKSNPATRDLCSKAIQLHETFKIGYSANARMSDGPGDPNMNTLRDITPTTYDNGHGAVVNEPEFRKPFESRPSKDALKEPLSDQFYNTDTKTAIDRSAQKGVCPLDEDSYFSESPLPSPRGTVSADLDELEKEESVKILSVPQIQEENARAIVDCVEGGEAPSIPQDTGELGAVQESGRQTGPPEKDAITGVLDGNEENEIVEQDNVMTEEDMDENLEVEIETIEEDQFESNGGVSESNNNVVVAASQASEEGDVYESESCASVDNPSDDGGGEVDINTEDAEDVGDDEESKSSGESAVNDYVEPDESVEEELASDESAEEGSEEEDLDSLEGQGSVGVEDVISLSSADNEQEGAVGEYVDEEPSPNNWGYEDNGMNVGNNVERDDIARDVVLGDNVVVDEAAIGEGAGADSACDESMASPDRDGEDADVEDEVDVREVVREMVPAVDIDISNKEVNLSSVAPVAETKLGGWANDSEVPDNSQSGIIAFAGRGTGPLAKVVGDVDTSQPVPMSPSPLSDPSQNRLMLAQSRYRPYVHTSSPVEASNLLRETQSVLKQLGEESGRVESVERREYDRRTQGAGTNSAVVCGSAGTLSQSSALHDDLFAPAPPPSPLFQSNLEADLNAAGVGHNSSVGSRRIGSTVRTNLDGAVVAMGGEAGVAFKKNIRKDDNAGLWPKNRVGTNVGKSLDEIATISTVGTKRIRELNCGDANGNVALQTVSSSRTGVVESKDEMVERPAKRVKRVSGLVENRLVMPTPTNAFKSLKPLLNPSNTNSTSGTYYVGNDADRSTNADILRRLNNIIEKEQGRKFEAFKDMRHEELPLFGPSVQRSPLFCVGTSSRNDHQSSRRILVNRFKKVKVVQLNDAAARQKLLEGSFNRVREAMRTSEVPLDETLRNLWERRERG